MIDIFSFIIGALSFAIGMLIYMCIKTFFAWRKRKAIVNEIISKLKQDGIYTDPDGNEWKFTDSGVDT